MQAHLAGDVPPWPFVGREAELETIAAARARPDVRGVVVLSDAGMGKTALARAAAVAAATDGALVEWVQATRSAASIPLAAFAALIPADVRSADALTILSGTAAALRERAGRRPAMLVVDDAQRLDEQSAALLLHLVLTGAVFVLCTVRTGEPAPDAIETLWKDASAERLELCPLDEAATERLSETALGGRVAVGTTGRLAAVSRGNLLFLREVMTTAVAGGTLVQEDGLWRAVRPLEASGTLTERIVERLSELAPPERHTLELLALGEPLRITRLDFDALAMLEQRALVAIDGTHARVAHPLYADVLRDRMPILRTHRVWRELATLLDGEPSSPDTALRMARWLLDAHQPIPVPTLLDAAHAALSAGDAQLATRFGRLAVDAAPSTQATMLLADARTQAGAFEEAEALLDAIEGDAETDHDALAYLQQRSLLLFWKLMRVEETAALIQRSAGWRPGAEWQRHVARMRLELVAVTEPADGVEIAEALLADPGLDEAPRHRVEAMYGLVLLLTGRTTESLEVSARNRSSPPLKQYQDQLVWSVYMRSSLAAGHDLPGVETWAQRAYTDASNVGDQAASGVAAFALGWLRLLEGRYFEAKRWLAEADVRYDIADPLGLRIGVTAIRVGVALGERDVDGAAAWRTRLQDLLGPAGTAPAAMAGFVRLAESWAALAETDLQSAQRVAFAGAKAPGASPVDAAQLLYEVFRAGAPPRDIAPLLSELAARTDAPFASAFAEHARSLAAGYGKGLTAIADALEALGARRYACEAAAHAASAFAAEGRMDSARRLATRARTLHLEGALPQMTGVDPNSVELTRRETQMVELASRGQSNPEIAERLVVSVRTVESHLYKAMQKLGVSDRRDL